MANVNHEKLALARQRSNPRHRAGAILWPRCLDSPRRDHIPPGLGRFPTNRSSERRMVWWPPPITLQGAAICRRDGQTEKKIFWRAARERASEPIHPVCTMRDGRHLLYR